MLRNARPCNCVNCDLLTVYTLWNLFSFFQDRKHRNNYRSFKSANIIVTWMHLKIFTLFSAHPSTRTAELKPNTSFRVHWNWKQRKQLVLVPFCPYCLAALITCLLGCLCSFWSCRNVYQEPLTWATEAVCRHYAWRETRRNYLHSEMNVNIYYRSNVLYL